MRVSYQYMDNFIWFNVSFYRIFQNIIVLQFLIKSVSFENKNS